MVTLPAITSAFHVAKGFGRGKPWFVVQQNAEARESVRTETLRHAKPGGVGTMTSVQVLILLAPSAGRSSLPGS